MDSFNSFQWRIVAAHHIKSDDHGAKMMRNMQKINSGHRFIVKPLCPECIRLYVQRCTLSVGSFFCYYFSFVVQFSFAHVRTVADMGFTRSAVCCQGSGNSFIVCPALCASLLTVSAFRIRHNSTIIMFILNL